MASNMREQMPMAAETVDWLREVFGKEFVDAQIRRSMKGEPTFWIRENGMELGTRDTSAISVVRWDAMGIAYATDPDWMIEARAEAARRGITIAPADPVNAKDIKREADELRQVLAATKGETKA